MNRKLALCCLVAVVLTACKTIQYVPVKEVEYVHIKDSVYLRDTLVQVEVQKARISDFSGLLDTLLLQTDLARSTAFVDTTAGVLRGTLEQRGEIPAKIQFKERIVYRDSIRDKEVPVPVEVIKEVKVVPWFWRFFSVLGIVALAGAVFWLLRKFHIL